jgi:hypothetical protein
LCRCRLRQAEVLTSLPQAGSEGELRFDEPSLINGQFQKGVRVSDPSNRLVPIAYVVRFASAFFFFVLSVWNASRRFRHVVITLAGGRASSC